MMRHRRNPLQAEDESSSDEEDAFSALSKKTSSTKGKQQQQKQDDEEAEKQRQQKQLPVSITSSMKRHHVTSNESRKAKLDALLLELESEKTRQQRATSSQGGSQQLNPHEQQQQQEGNDRRKGFFPEKKGSFVDPGEEHLTTNIFVGNLAPSITEEQLTDFFRQFGELYSVKIMWPRTAEERARNRNTGFVCFMHREDAEEAMEECSEADPFKVGRRLMMRWGKNVKKTIKRGTGGVATTPSLPTDIKKRVLPAQPASPQKTTPAAAPGVSLPSEQKNNAVNDDSGFSPATKRLKVAEDEDNLSNDIPESNEYNAHANNTGAAITIAASTTATEEQKPTISSLSMTAPLAEVLYDATIHEKDAIRVRIPMDPTRAGFISTIASFVAKDGSPLENRLMELEFNNPEFDFLVWNKSSSATKTSENGNGDNNEIDIDDIKSSGALLDEKKRKQQEHIFYKWRVYSFCQGDGINTWRTEPFVMIHPNGRFWIPPKIDKEAAWKEEEEKRIVEEKIKQKQQRRRLRNMGGIKQKLAEFSTGRQLERTAGGSASNAGSAADGGAKLNPDDWDQLNILLNKKLNTSRKSICEAMAFCFEKSAAAKQISNLLKEALLENSPRVTVETRIARLYLLSDVLFNSQQPGVRNAFLYRNAIEQMAPEVFTSLGKHGAGPSCNGNDGDDSNDKSQVVFVGRLSMNKLKSAVSSVLGAWTNWSVYNPMFMDELQAYFEGREIKKEDNNKTNGDDDDDLEKEDLKKIEDAQAASVRIISDKKLGNWKEVNEEDEDSDSDDGSRAGDDINDEKFASTSDMQENAPREPVLHSNRETPRDKVEYNTSSIDEDDNVDGEPMYYDVDGEALDEEDVDGQPLTDDDIDGEPLSDDDIDGGPLEDGDIDGELLVDDDIDGEILDSADVDGEPLEEDEEIPQLD